ncbi:MAG: GNAT family N-acetyltransferase [Chitinophagales bacterium]|nr:GNAT family N-acetyltransferase [Chitinophagales bacterium]
MIAEIIVLNIIRYNPSWKQRWDNFISESKNATFLFYRDYMDYHSDRFQDHSLMITEDDHLIALLPLNKNNESFISHEGLTYGGFLCNSAMKQKRMNNCFDVFLNYAKEEGVREIIYKAIPGIYHTCLTEEDLYSLFIYGFELHRRDSSATLIPSCKVKLRKDRKAKISRAGKMNLQIKQSKDFSDYFKIVDFRLQSKYHARAAHNAKEIELLAEKFPENIKLFACYQNTEMIGGTLIYESKNVAHAQYIAASNAGEQMGAIDLLIYHLLSEVYKEKKYLDLGKSTEQEGRWLNENLMSFKESFGAKISISDFYRIKI